MIVKDSTDQQKSASSHNLTIKSKQLIKKYRILKLFLFFYSKYLNSYINKDTYTYIYKYLYRFVLLFLKSKKNVDVLNQIRNYKNLYKFDIPYLNLFITKRCNINCKGCGALMPLYNKSKGFEYIKIEDLGRVLDRYNEISNNKNFDKIDIVGGEPLLHPNIVGIFKCIRERNKNSSITLTTNGLLLKNKDKNFFLEMEKYDINLSISIYGDDCYFEKINISEDEDIPHENCSSCSGHVAVYHKGMHKISVGGVTLDAKGNLYYCGFNEVYKFNDFFSTNYELIYGSDYINIYNVSSYSEILKMMQQENCHFSKYCKGREVFQWNVSECDISEWQK